MYVNFHTYLLLKSYMVIMFQSNQKFPLKISSGCIQQLASLHNSDVTALAVTI